MLKNFLSQLGSPREIAAELEAISSKRCTVVAVYQWPYEGRIADKWAPWVAKLAKKKKIKNVPPEIMGYMQ